LKNIAVEKGLSNISDFLKENGYKVNEINVRQKSSRDFTEGFDAVVLSGMNNDFMGIETTPTKSPIIIASGLMPQDIKARIEAIGTVI
jgi:galactitol-specific phosphotransferase system IIB component